MAPFSAPFISLDGRFFPTVPHVLCKSSVVLHIISTPMALQRPGNWLLAEKPRLGEQWAAFLLYHPLPPSPHACFAEAGPAGESGKAARKRDVLRELDSPSYPYLLTPARRP